MRAGHNYGALFVLLVVTFVFIAAAPDDAWASGVLILLQAVSLLAALWTSGFAQDRRPLIPLAIVVASIGLAVYIFESNSTLALAAIVDAVLIAATIAVVGIGIVDQREVNPKSVSGALCIYVLIGMMFAFIFNAAAVIGEGAFFADGSDGTPFERLYFSYVTMATLGYGDYTAGTTFGRSLAVAELLIGQLFLVTAVALVVGLLVSGRAGTNDKDDGAQRDK
jgi:hypothetical protein